MKREDKQAICNALCTALQLTRSGSDISEIRYNAEGEYGWLQMPHLHIPI